MRRHRVLTTTALAVIGVLVPLAPAAAAPSESQPVTLHFPGQDTAGSDGFCPYPVTAVETSYQQLRGGVKVTGHGSATVINDVTGKSLTFNVSGPGSVTFSPDGSVTVDASGPNLFFWSPSTGYPGVPYIAYTTGHLRFTVDGTSYATTSYELTGRTTDVCAALS